MTEKTYKHWRLNTDADNILWLTIDRENASVNSLNREVFEEFDHILDAVIKQSPAGIIIQSGKAKGFVAGADITQFTTIKSADDAYDLIRQAQVVLDKLEALDVPSVAMIKGFCLGGGCELALACRYRVAEEGASTRIGLPEVKLGLHPGWGGTVRLPNLIGPIAAMKIMLPGAAVSARAAARIGMVDAAVPERELRRAALHYIQNHPPKRKPPMWTNIFKVRWLRSLLASQFYNQLRTKNVQREHYPAPYAIVDNWVRDAAQGSAMTNEAKSIADLMMGSTSRSLVRAFFLQERMKGLAKGVQFKPKHIHVIGAGTMGGDIAAWCAYKGLHVTLQDQSPKHIAPAIRRAHKLFRYKLKQPRLIQAAMDRLQPDETGRGVISADVIIEAVFEDLNLKQKIFTDLLKHARSDALLATNTSSIPLEEISSVLDKPSRLVGIHFFNPVSKMQLVEVVRGKQTSDDVMQNACAFVGRIGHLPLPVGSRSGFLVNRILMPYLLEAITLLEEGHAPEEIDKAALDFGMPMGPITLADKVGLDVCMHVAEILSQHFGGEIPKRLRTLFDAGHFGVKTGQGFYLYKQGQQLIDVTTTAPSNNADLFTQRMIGVMVNEAVACLEEGIVSDADLLDAGMIFGTGFAPFRGGPIQYAQSEGIDNMVSMLEALQKEYGERFKPSSGWKHLNRQGGEGLGKPELTLHTVTPSTRPDHPSQATH